ncbi:MAG: hypothetical protein ABJF10_27315 [Chthoniobacter sp.]|uniref:hypothetical protein n=1 Tax=Chthoniobacter sp. TaxID=2510640 RepID=UPI0032A5C47C
MKFYSLLLWALLVAITSGASDPDHLVPVNPHQPWLTHYGDAVHSCLKLDPYDYLQMVILPSFVAESAVCLRSGSGDQKIENAGKIVLVYAVATENIFSSMPESNLKKKPEDVPVTVTTVEFPKPLALRLYKLWSRMLLRTRYS